MNEKTINENNEKLMAQAEENAKAVTSTETAEKEQTPKANGDIEAYNYFGGNEHVSPINGSLNYRKTLFTIKGVGGFDLPIEVSYNSERAHSV